jgi:hypothetical protein
LPGRRSEFNIGNYEKHLRAADPWQGFFKSRQSLALAIKALSRI